MTIARHAPPRPACLARLATDRSVPVIAAIRPVGTTSSPPITTGGSGEIWRSSRAPPAASGDGPGGRRRACVLVGVEPGVRPSGLLLKLQLLGAVVPVVDLLRQAVLDRGLGLVDQRDRAAADLREMLGHDVGDGVALGLLLQLARNPGALGSGQDRVDVGLVVGQRPVVEVRRVVQVAGLARGVELDVEHPLGDDAALAARVGWRPGSRAPGRRARAAECRDRVRPRAPCPAAADRGGAPGSGRWSRRAAGGRADERGQRLPWGATSAFSKAMRS